MSVARDMVIVAILVVVLSMAIASVLEYEKQFIPCGEAAYSGHI